MVTVSLTLSIAVLQAQRPAPPSGHSRASRERRPPENLATSPPLLQGPVTHQEHRLDEGSPVQTLHVACLVSLRRGLLLLSSCLGPRHRDGHDGPSYISHRATDSPRRRAIRTAPPPERAAGLRGPEPHLEFLATLLHGAGPRAAAPRRQACPSSPSLRSPLGKAAGGGSSQPQPQGHVASLRPKSPDTFNAAPRSESRTCAPEPTRVCRLQVSVCEHLGRCLGRCAGGGDTAKCVGR